MRKALYSALVWALAVVGTRAASVTPLFMYDTEYSVDGSIVAAFVVENAVAVGSFSVDGLPGEQIGAFNGRNQVFLVKKLKCQTTYQDVTWKADGEEGTITFTTPKQTKIHLGGAYHSNTKVGSTYGASWFLLTDEERVVGIDVHGAETENEARLTLNDEGWTFTSSEALKTEHFVWPEIESVNGHDYVVLRVALRTRSLTSTPTACKFAVSAPLYLGTIAASAERTNCGFLLQGANPGALTLGVFTRPGRGGTLSFVDREATGHWFGAADDLGSHLYDDITTERLSQLGAVDQAAVSVSWSGLDLSGGDFVKLSVVLGVFDAETLAEDAGDPCVSYTAEGWEGTYDGRPHGITVTPREPTDAKLQYALYKEGPYRDDPYAFTDVNETPIDVWFRLEADGRAAVTNSARVVIRSEGGDGEPGSGDVPPGGLSRFDASAVYDGLGHTFDTNGLTAAYRERVLNPPLTYSLAENGPWTAAAPSFTNAGEHVCWYRYGSEDNPNVKLFKHPAKVTISPRAVKLTSGTQSWPYDGEAHSNVTVTVEGTFAAGEGVTTNGFATIVEIGETPNSFEYELILNPGSILENYAVTCVTGTLAITRAELAAEIAWKYLKASGTYMAQLKVTCTGDLSAGIDDLRFMFADRVSDGVTYASLWDTPRRAAKSTTMSYKGDMYRYVALDPSKITAENVPVTYGVSDLSASSIPTAERTIELYVRKRVNPTAGNEEVAEVESFVGYVGWTSGGETTYLPVVAGAQAASLARANVTASSPMKVSALNAALAVGAAVTDDSSPYCRLSEFSVEGNVICGRVEVGAVSADGKESAGTLGPNVAVSLLGAPTLGCDFRPLGTVKTDDAGRFRVVKPDDCRFYRLRLTVEEVVQ